MGHYYNGRNTSVQENHSTSKSTTHNPSSIPTWRFRRPASLASSPAAAPPPSLPPLSRTMLGKAAMSPVVNAPYR